MKIERTKNATRNIVFGTILKAYQILIPFLMRTAMIYLLGIQYLGLNSLFISILQVLNLTELGVGSAMIYSMYKPIAEDDVKTICALMRLYKIYYSIIGLVIAVIGILVTPFIPILINGYIPEGINIYFLYLLNLFATVLSYWLMAYKSSVLYAYQRVDVVSKVTIVTNSIQYILQFLVLWLLHNYYIYVIVILGMQTLTNIFTAIVVGRLYPNCRPEGRLEKQEIKEINGKIRDLFTSKFGAVIVNSADTVVISAFFGLTTLAIYQNYFYILTSVIGFVSIIFSSCSAGIGNSLIKETREKNFADLKKFTFLISWIAGLCTSCFLCLYQPFMKIWMHGDENLMMNFSVVICFCIYYFVYEINQLLTVYKDAGGIWHQDRFRPLVTALTNLGMNLIMVQFCGIYGIILSTILSILFVGMPWLLYNLFTTLFEMKQLLGYLKRLALYVTVSMVASILTLGICSLIQLGNWATLIIRLILCGIIPNAMFLCIYHKLPEFQPCLQLIDKMTRGKLKLEERLCKLFYTCKSIKKNGE